MSLSILIVRHGVTEHNKQVILQGHHDTDLSLEGFDQARKAGEHLLNENFTLDAAWSSDLKRCACTAKQMLESSNCSSIPLEFTQELRERDLGELQNMTLADAKAKAAAEGKDVLDYGEPLAAVNRRLNTCLDRIILESIEKNYSRVLVVSHGKSISTFVKHMISELGYTTSFHSSVFKVPNNTSFTRVEIDKQTRKGKLIMYGDYCHLSAAASRYNPRAI